MDNTIIAVVGKGGVGKTSISARVVKTIVDKKRGARILAIDADPAVGLATALGIDVKYTLDDIRKEIVKSGEGDKTKKKAIELLAESKFKMVETLIECDGFTFMAIGRPETAGCYCSINNVLRDVLTVISEQFDYVIIDGEAGIEQINRRVMKDISHLIFVTDQSQKGMNVVKTIKSVADNLSSYEKSGIIVNRLHSQEMLSYLDSGDIEILSVVKEDVQLLENDAKGISVFEIADDSPLAIGVNTALTKLEII